ncbi:MAG: TetR/AcrR family transcriptional regulator, partial [Mycobacterium sp.]|nr:TetR/AcrR family transcriptional regulator [Mycobacterium sp.]
MTESARPVTTTRTRILQEASRLFNERGYHGASTREIAGAVGVRQQSLSHHFPTKRAILEELLAETLDEPLRVVQSMRAADGSPAARLYAYIRFDVAHLQQSPYVLQGLFGTYLLKDPDLVKWYDGASDLYDAVAAIVAEGVAAGEFRDIEPDFAAAAVGALIEQAFSVWA